jgi:hypothetical protein
MEAIWLRKQEAMHYQKRAHEEIFIFTQGNYN